jgi:hypothetical protein
MRGKVKMETIKRINEDLIRKTTTVDIDLKPLKEELIKINKQLVYLEKEPDEIMMPNDSKFFMIEVLKRRKEEINNLLK